MKKSHKVRAGRSKTGACVRHKALLSCCACVILFVALCVPVTFVEARDTNVGLAKTASACIDVAGAATHLGSGAAAALALDGPVDAAETLWTLQWDMAGTEAPDKCHFVVSKVQGDGTALDLLFSSTDKVGSYTALFTNSLPAAAEGVVGTVSPNVDGRVSISGLRAGAYKVSQTRSASGTGLFVPQNTFTVDFPGAGSMDVVLETWYGEMDFLDTGESTPGNRVASFTMDGSAAQSTLADGDATLWDMCLVILRLFFLPAVLCAVACAVDCLMMKSR